MDIGLRPSKLDGRSVSAPRQQSCSRGEDSAPVGRRTDIEVQALQYGATDQTAAAPTVVIETKRCSNVDVLTSLRSQLVEEYLKPLGYHYGIYLVGSFDCPARKCCSSHKTLDELRVNLQGRAKAEAPNFSVVAIVLDTGLRDR
jgi:hypothetical protein